MHPLLYLTLYSFKNRMQVRLHRLREPRYLVGFIVGLVYFYSVFFRSAARAGPASFFSIAGGSLGSIEVVASLVLFLILAAAWIPQGTRSPTLSFTRAEVQ